MMQFNNFIRFFTACAAMLISHQGLAAQLDIMPDDYVVRPDATSVAINYIDRRQMGPYAKGNQASNAEINTDVVSLRVSKFMEVAGYTVAPVAVISYRDIQTEPLAWQRLIGKEASGFKGDFGFGGTLWLKNDRAQQNFVAVTAFMTVPTGSYDAKQIINLSENRWRFILGGAWSTAIGEHWVNELYPEIAWFGDNEEFKDYRKLKYFFNPNLNGQETLSQHMSYALTDTLRYKLTPQWQAFISAQINGGGKTYVNDVLFSEAAENTRMSVGGIYYTERGQQWLVRYSRDVAIENGFRNAKELTVRYMHYF